MSSRQLRKLQQQRELEQAQLRQQNLAAEGSEEGEDAEEEFQAPPTKQSLFANFAMLEDADDDDDDDDDEAKPEEPNDTQLVPDEGHTEEIGQ
jgi:hypothetical protein